MANRNKVNISREWGDGGEVVIVSHVGVHIAEARVLLQTEKNRLHCQLLALVFLCIEKRPIYHIINSTLLPLHHRQN